MENKNMSLLDDVMNQSMGDAESAPEFIMPPSGRYILSVDKAELEEFSWKDKETQEPMSAVSAKIVYSVVSTEELADAAEVPVPNGSLFAESVSMDFNGVSPLKTYLEKFFGDNVNQYTFVEGVSALNGLKFSCVVRVKANKKGFDNARTSQQTVITE
jgi:hypothetical protein